MTLFDSAMFFSLKNADNSNKKPKKNLKLQLLTFPMNKGCKN